MLGSSLSCSLWLKSSRNLVGVWIVALTMGPACYSSTDAVLQIAQKPWAIPAWRSELAPANLAKCFLEPGCSQNGAGDGQSDFSAVPTSSYGRTVWLLPSSR